MKVEKTMSQSARPVFASPDALATELADAQAAQLDRAASRRLAAAVLVAAVVGALVIVALGGGAVARSWVQLATGAVVVALLWRLALGGIRIPRLVLVGAAVAAASGAVLRLIALDISEQSFVVAQLKEDSLQADAKILRDRMRAAAAHESPVHIGTISRQLASAQEAQALLDRDSSVWGVAWGSPRWTNVTLREAPPLALSSLPTNSYARQAMQRFGLPDSNIKRSLPLIGVSDAKLPQTGEFVGRLAQLWPRFSSQVVSGENVTELEGELRSLAAMKAPWTSNAHLALPMFMIGTLHLVQAIAGPQVEESELLCAVSAFGAALAQLQPGENRDLRMAIRNNLAIAMRFRAGVDLGVKQAKAQARAILDGRVKKRQQKGQPANQHRRPQRRPAAS